MHLVIITELFPFAFSSANTKAKENTEDTIIQELLANLKFIQNHRVNYLKDQKLLVPNGLEMPPDKMDAETSWTKLPEETIDFCIDNLVLTRQNFHQMSESINCANAEKAFFKHIKEVKIATFNMVPLALLQSMESQSKAFFKACAVSFSRMNKFNIMSFLSRTYKKIIEDLVKKRQPNSNKIQFGELNRIIENLIGHVKMEFDFTKGIKMTDWGVKQDAIQTSQPPWRGRDNTEVQFPSHKFSAQIINTMKSQKIAHCSNNKFTHFAMWRDKHKAVYDDFTQKKLKRKKNNNPF